MKILCTGASGWIGGRVVKALSEVHSDDVQIVDHRSEMFVVTEAAQWADIVIHCGGEYTNDRSRFVEGNIEQAIALAKGCSKTSNAVIFLSSVKIYGWAWSDGYVCTERDCGAANDRFGRSKLIAESVFADAATASTFLRISNVYGDGVPEKYAIGTMLKTTKTAGEVVLSCNGESARDFVHIDDVVRVVVGAVGKVRHSLATDEYSDIVNVSSGELITLNNVADIFKLELGTETVRKNGRVLSSPGYSNGKALELLRAGGGGQFIDSRSGIKSLLNKWAADNFWRISNAKFIDNSSASR